MRTWVAVVTLHSGGRMAVADADDGLFALVPMVMTGKVDGAVTWCSWPEADGAIRNMLLAMPNLRNLGKFAAMELIA